jgi:hypothetical protein
MHHSRTPREERDPREIARHVGLLNEEWITLGLSLSGNARPGMPVRERETRQGVVVSTGLRSPFAAHLTGILFLLTAAWKQARG